MNEVFRQLCESDWKEGEEPYTLINSKNYRLVEDTESWLMLLDPEGKRIWDYPILNSHKVWICNSINRDCKNNLLLKS